jgi:hypothetical protein
VAMGDATYTGTVFLCTVSVGIVHSVEWQEDRNEEFGKDWERIIHLVSAVLRQFL